MRQQRLARKSARTIASSRKELAAACLNNRRSPRVFTCSAKRRLSVRALQTTGSAQTARQGKTRAGAGLPGTIGRHGSRRQTSNHRNQTSVIIDRPLEGARAAIWAAPSPGCDEEIVKFKNLPPKHSTTLYPLYHTLRPRAWGSVECPSTRRASLRSTPLYSTLLGRV